MLRYLLFFSVVALLVGHSGEVRSQDFYVYPKAGQDNQTVERDKFECYQWAKQQTGYDPSRGASSYQSEGDYQPRGDIARGAARGAAAGAVIGGIAGDTGKGAAIGAASGGMIGGMQRRDRIKSSPSTRQQHAQSTYGRAYAACLEARNYAVK